MDIITLTGVKGTRMGIAISNISSIQDVEPMHLNNGAKTHIGLVNSGFIETKEPFDQVVNAIISQTSGTIISIGKTV